MKLVFVELLKNLFSEPVTVNFPYETEGLNRPERYRGLHIIDQDKCIGCRRCARECPVEVIEMVPLTPEELTKRKDKKKVKPVFHLAGCIFCGVCEEVCPVKCINLTNNIPNPTEKTDELVVE